MTYTHLETSSSSSSSCLYQTPNSPSSKLHQRVKATQLNSPSIQDHQLRFFNSNPTLSHLEYGNATTLCTTRSRYTVGTEYPYLHSSIGWRYHDRWCCILSRSSKAGCCCCCSSSSSRSDYSSHFNARNSPTSSGGSNSTSALYHPPSNPFSPHHSGSFSSDPFALTFRPMLLRIENCKRSSTQAKSRGAIECSFHLEVLLIIFLQAQSTQPVYAPYVQQPQTVYQPYYSPLTMHPTMNGTSNFQQPSFGQFGYTPNEVLVQNMVHAAAPEMSTKQEMKPADDDPLRFYWVRELDQSWSQRNRLTIDSGDIGDCRWYAKDGEFYAIRLPMS